MPFCAQMGSNSPFRYVWHSFKFLSDKHCCCIRMALRERCRACTRCESKPWICTGCCTAVLAVESAFRLFYSYIVSVCIVNCGIHKSTTSQPDVRSSRTSAIYSVTLFIKLVWKPVYPDGLWYFGLLLDSIYQPLTPRKILKRDWV